MVHNMFAHISPPWMVEGVQAVQFLGGLAFTAELRASLKMTGTAIIVSEVITNEINRMNFLKHELVKGRGTKDIQAF